MLKRSLAILALSLVGMSLGAVRLRADDLSFTLSYTNGFTTCPAGGCATVNINASGGTATITVTSLLNGYQFDEFGFNIGSAVTLKSASGGGLEPGFGLGGANQLDGFGTFDYVFKTGLSGGSDGGNCTVSGGTESAGCSFTFTLTGSGLTSYSVFEVLSTNGNGQGDVWFAGHVANGSQCTGFVGGDNGVSAGVHNGSSACVTTPEPNTLSLLGSGVFALLLAAAFFRRRAITFTTA